MHYIALLKARSNKSLQLTFDPPLGLATPNPPVGSNAAELRRWASLHRCE